MGQPVTVSTTSKDNGIVAALVGIGAVLLLLAVLYVGEELRFAVLTLAALLVLGITAVVPNWAITIAYPLTWIIWWMTMEAIGGRPERVIVILGLIGATVMVARQGKLTLGVTKSVGWGLAIFVMMFVVALYANPDSPKATEVVFSIVFRIIFLWLVMLQIRSEQDLRVALAVFVAVSFIPAVVTLWLGWQYGFGFIRVYSTMQIVSSSVDPFWIKLSATANFCTIAAALLLAWSSEPSQLTRKRWMIAGSLFLFAMAFLAQLRREVMITIPVLLGILAVDRESRVRTLARHILIAGIIAFPLLIYPNFEVLQMRFHDDNPRMAEGTDPRIMNLAAGLSAFLESPFIGTGPGSYARTIMPHMGWFQASSMYAPYNVFMWVAVEAGILAAVGLLVLLYGVLREGLQWRRQAKGMCSFVLRLAPVMIGQIVIWFTFGAAWDLSLPFFFMGMILAAARITKENQPALFRRQKGIPIV